MFTKLKKAAQHWNKVSKMSQASHISWWQSQTIVDHINAGFTEQSGLFSIPAGDVAALQKRFPNRSFKRGISVGCGNGSKEIALIRSGVVEHFDCFEISDVRIKNGQAKAKSLGIADQISFRMEDAFAFTETNQGVEYDFVYWNNALHHMLDVENAVRWSHQCLQAGGVFYMNDFVGPTRMQWSDRSLEIASRVRQALPDKYLVNHRDPQRLLAKRLVRPDPDKLAAVDPTECADSARILASVKKYFADAEIILTGGVIYHTALNDVLHNIDESEDKFLLDLLLIIDDLCTMLGETHYAVAIASKHRL